MGNQASENYYNLSLLAIGVGIPSFLIFLFFLYSEPRKALLMFILVFPIFPSLNNYLKTFGSGIWVSLTELLIAFLLFYFITIRNKSIGNPKSVIYFSIFWVILNTSTYLISDFSTSSLIGYILSIAFVFLLLAMSTFLVMERESKGIHFYKTPLLYFMLSLAVYIVACYFVLLANYGTEIFTSIFDIGRIEDMSGFAYIDFNAMSGISLLSIPLAIFFFLQKENGIFFKVTFFALITCVTFLVLIDKSRGGFVAFIVLISWILISNIFPSFSKKSKSSSSKFWAISISLLTGALFIFFAGDVVIRRFAGIDLGMSVALIDIIRTTIVSSRGELLLLGFDKFLENPLFGNGYGTLLYVVQYNVYWDSHNLILESLVSIGLLGTGSLFYLFISTYFKYKINKKFFSLELLNLQKALWITIVIFLVFGLTTGMHSIDTGSRISFFPIYLYSFLILLSLHVSEQANFKDPKQTSP